MELKTTDSSVNAEQFSLYASLVNEPAGFGAVLGNHKFTAAVCLLWLMEVGDRSFVLTHSGLDRFSPDRPLPEYRLENFLFCRPGPDTVYFPDKFLVFGHTPTRYLSNQNKILRRET